MAALARTVRTNIPQTRNHPSHEVLVDDWSHAYALAQNRRINHPLRQAVLTVARKMDGAGVGRLFLGRRGKKTRFSLPSDQLAAWLDAFDALADRDNAPRREPPSPTGKTVAQPSSPPKTVAASPASPNTPATLETAEASTPLKPAEASAPGRKSGAATSSKSGAHSANDDPKASRPTPAQSLDRRALAERPLAGLTSRLSRPPTNRATTNRTTTDGATTERSSAEPQAMIEHRFVVRPNYAVTFELPIDLTDVEARRLARFVIALPFELEDD